jgi:hypothetical protein
MMPDAEHRRWWRATVGAMVLVVALIAFSVIVNAL